MKDSNNNYNNNNRDNNSFIHNTDLDNNHEKDIDNSKPDRFTVIHGDRLVSPDLAGGDFVKAEVTNTRLMGVMGLHLVRASEQEEFHQLFHLDFEENGIDEYKSHKLIKMNADEASEYDYRALVEMDMDDMFGGLGGDYIDITEEEAIALINAAFALNEEYETPLPDIIDEFSHLLSIDFSLDEKAEMKLWNKICVDCKNDFELVNYFIMRLAAMDFKAADYLSATPNLYESFPKSEPGALYKNEIKIPNEGQNSISLFHEYISTSLIEDDMGFKIVVSKISVAGPKVISFQVEDEMRISPWEASLIMSQKEYVSRSISDATRGYISLSTIIKSLYPKSEVNPHAGGTLFMLLKENNGYVANQVFRLDDDVIVSIFLRYNGEIVIAGKDAINVGYYEDVLIRLSNTYGISIPTFTHYLFPEPVMGHYVNEDYGEFDDFLEYIQFLSQNEDL